MSQGKPSLPPQPPLPSKPPAAPASTRQDDSLPLRGDISVQVLTESVESLATKPPKEEPAPTVRTISSLTPFTQPPPHPLKPLGVPKTPTLSIDAVGPLQSAKTLKDAWEKEVQAEADARRKAWLHVQIAHLCEYPLREPKAAHKHYRQALTFHPDHLPSLQGARRAAVCSGNYEDALQWLQNETRITAEPSQKAWLMVLQGRYLEDHLGKPDEAQLCYAGALELDRLNPLLLKSLEQRLESKEAWTELDPVYERLGQAAIADVRYQAALLVQRAHLAEHVQKTPEKAIQLLEQAIQLDPSVRGGIDGLKRLLHTHARWKSLIGVLELEVTFCKEPARRAESLHRISKIYAERLSERANALATIQRAATECPDHPLVLTELVHCYEEERQLTPLIYALQKLIEITHNPWERLILLQRIGQLTEEHLKDEDAAISWYEAAMEIDSAYVPTLQSLTKLYTKRQDWPALIRMYLAEADATSDIERRAAIYARVADLLETRLNRSDEAILHHARAINLVTNYAPSFRALTRLYSASHQWKNLAELYERAVTHAKDDELAFSYLFKIGALYEDALGDPGRAVQTYKRILERAPHHLGAIHSLERAAERAERYTELIEALELEASLSSPPEKAMLLHRAAEVLDEKIKDTDAALFTYRRVLEVDESYRPTLRNLGKLYHRLGRWEDLLHTYQKEVDLSPDDPVTATLLHKMAELCETRIGNEAQAVLWYEKSLEKDPKHVPTLTALAHIHKKNRSWAELIRVLELRLEGLDKSELRAQTRLQIGEVFEDHLGDLNKAIAAYQSAAKELPSFQPAMDAAQRLLSSRGEWKPLVDDISELVRQESDAMRKVTLLAREAEVWTYALSDLQRAAQALEQIMELEPENISAALALESIQRRLKQWEPLAHVYRIEARIIQDPGVKASALHQLTNLIQTRLKAQPDELRLSYETILQTLPDDQLGLEYLYALVLEEKDLSSLVPILRTLAELAAEPSVANAHRTTMAQVSEALGEPHALEAYRAVAQQDPKNLVAIEGMIRTARAQQHHAFLAEGLRLRAPNSKSPETAAQTLLQSAKIRQHELQDSRGAVADLERALELCPENPEVAEELSKVLLVQGQVNRLMDILTHALQASKTPERTVSLGMQVARMQADVQQNLPQAIATLKRVQAVAPDNLSTLQKLAELYALDNQSLEAIGSMKRLMSLDIPVELRLQTQLAMAAIYDERLGEVKEAKKHLEEVIRSNPQERTALERLTVLEQREGDFANASVHAAQLIKLAKTPEEKVDALIRLAHIELGQKNRQSALKTLLQAVVIQGGGSKAADETRRLLTLAEGAPQAPLPESLAQEWLAYAQALQEHLSSNPSSAAVETSWIELAHVHAMRLDHIDEGIRILQHALSQNVRSANLELTLAFLLRKSGRIPQALQSLREIIERDVSYERAWRELATAWIELGDYAAASCALEPLAVLDVIKDTERQMLREKPNKPAQALSSSLSAERIEQILPSKEDLYAAELLNVLSETLPKLYPADLEGYGITSQDKISTESNHPLRALVNRLASIFEAPSFDLYVHRARARSVSLEFTTPLSILVPAALLELPLSQQVFMLGQVFTSLTRGLAAVHKLTSREIEVLLASAARTVAPEYGRGLTSEDFLNEQNRKILRALSRKNRKPLEDAATRYIGSMRIQVPAWLKRVEYANDAMAGLIADDVAGAAEVIARGDKDLSVLKGATLVAGSPRIQQLMRFWVSEPAQRWRKEAGLLR